MNPIFIRSIAERQLREEAQRRAIDAEKIKILHRKTIWSRIFPFTITITRKTP